VQTKKAGKSRFALVAAVAAAVLALALALFWLVRTPAEPRSAVRRLWKERGVEKPNVVLITLDTTRADHLGCYGYAPAKTPTIDALAARGVLFDQALSAVPLTQPAHSSVMTGMYPTYECASTAAPLSASRRRRSPRS
jgi:hypothetical protein